MKSGMCVTMRQQKQLGSILVEKSILTHLSVERLLTISKKQKKRFGWTLEDLGLVTGQELAEALAEQFEIEPVSHLIDIPWDNNALSTMAVEFALEHLLFPISLKGKELTLAIADPTNMKVINNFGENSGFQVKPCVACRRDIYDAINKFYIKKIVYDSKLKTVLIVDNDHLVRIELKKMLEKHGYNVETAKDGIDGFKEVIACNPRVIITNRILPKLDGIMLLKAIKAIPKLRTIPVILVSDNLSAQDEARVFKIGFFDYINKPIKEETIISRVDRALDLSY